MPTEENQNVQTGGNSNMLDQASTDNITDNTVKNITEDNIDIDLNLDGLDIPVDSKPNEDIAIEKIDDEGIKDTETLNEASNDNSGDDRLVQEDKKVEELQQEDIKIEPKIEEAEDKKEDGIKLEEVKEEESENVEDIIVEEKQDETAESMMESLDEEGLENLNISENSEIDNADTNDDREVETVEDNQEESNVDFTEDNIDDVKIEELETLDAIDESTEIEEKNNDIKVDGDTTVSDIQKEDTAVEGQLDLNNLDFAENTGEENIGEENIVNNDELHVENLGEDIVENTQGDIVSDTGDAKVNEGDYIPNEHDFAQITTAMDKTKPGGEIDLGELEMNDDNSNNLELGIDKNSEVVDNTQIQGGVDLDSMIADLGNTDGLDAEKIVEAPVAEPVINDVVESATTVNVSEAVNEPVLNSPVVNVAPVQNNIPVQNQVVQNQPVVVSEPQHIKSKHTGLKVLLAIVVLFVGGIFILSKMYPEEVGDIMSAMKGGDTTVVEYSDNANSNADLSETVVDNDLPLVDEINTGAEDAIDPDSLAGQIDDQNIDDTVVAEDNTDIDGSVSTGSTSDTGFDAFAEIDDVMDIPSGENAELLDKLSTYKEQGSDYNEWGRTINNTTAMKYGSFILKKAGELITSIENNEQIDNTKVDKYFAQFDKYLEKLDGLRTSIDGESQDDALVSTGIDESNTENTSGTDTVQ